MLFHPTMACPMSLKVRWLVKMLWKDSITVYSHCSIDFAWINFHNTNHLGGRNASMWTVTVTTLPSWQKQKMASSWRQLISQRKGVTWIQSCHWLSHNLLAGRFNGCFTPLFTYRNLTAIAPHRGGQDRHSYMAWSNLGVTISSTSIPSSIRYWFWYCAHSTAIRCLPTSWVSNMRISSPLQTTVLTQHYRSSSDIELHLIDCMVVDITHAL